MGAFLVEGHTLRDLKHNAMRDTSERCRLRVQFVVPQIEGMEIDVYHFVSRAVADGAVPVMIAHNIPLR